MELSQFPEGIAGNSVCFCGQERSDSKTHKIRDFGVSRMRPAADSRNESGLGLQLASRKSYHNPVNLKVNIL